jgi:hypothetical protein
MHAPVHPPCRTAGLLPLLAAACVTAMAQPVINEVMSDNARTLADADGEQVDWIELHNPGTVPADLTGWYLTDVRDRKTEWKFPATILPAGGYLVVFASGKDHRTAGAPLHTNFKLNADGDYLALVKADGVTVAQEWAVPALPADVSYGLPRGATTPTLLAQPTPGAANSAARPAPITQRATFSRAAGTFTGTFTLQLAGAGANQVVRYVSAPSAAAADLANPTAASPGYSAPIAVSASVVIKAAVFSSDGVSRGPVTTTHYLRLAASTAAFSGRLPVMVIDSLGSGPLVKDEIDRPAWAYLFAAPAAGATVFGRDPATRATLTTKVRGTSSALFPKKGLSLDFNDDWGGTSKPALLDLPADGKWALVGNWKYDLSYLNNALMYALSNQLGRWAPRTRFVEVFLNTDGGDLDASDYAGVYALTDRIEPGNDRVDIHDLDPGDTSGKAVEGGYIIKVDSAAPGEVSWRTSRGLPSQWGSSLILTYPAAEDVAPAQLSYLRGYVQAMEDALYADQASGWSRRTHLDYLDRASWVDHHLLNVLACNPDALIRSAYFTKDRGERLKAGPIWDFDRALGSYWDERSFRPDTWTGVGGSDCWESGWWGVLARDPEFMQAWVDRWQDLRRGVLAEAAVSRLAETLGGQVGGDAMARDAARWPDNLSPYGSYPAQVDRVKGWLAQRSRWIDDQFLRAPAVATTGTTLTFTAPEGAQLAYTLDGSDPRALGGDIAVNARLTSAPLTVAAAANVHVRSYRASLRGTYPGSPWSSAVGGNASSPLFPRARIVNLASRAIAGAADDALIAGVVVADTDGKRYLTRGIGPALTAFGAAGALADPQLTIQASTGAELFRNRGWGTGPEAAGMPGYFRSVGAFPLEAGSADSALASDLRSGSYTLQVVSAAGRSGLALAELYELDDKGRTINLSSRSRVRSGEGALIGGFVVQGPAHARMLLRGVGPTLAAFGLTDALREPVLTVYAGQNVVATNERWEAGDNVAAVTAASRLAGAFALAAGSADTALFLTLAPGAYTVELKGRNNTEGVGLLEIYAVP